MEPSPDTETTALLSHEQQQPATPGSPSTPRVDEPVSENEVSIEDINRDEPAFGRVLPLAFTTAFAIAATSATSMYAYASLMCKDASRCKDDERNRYASVVAAAGTTANVFGVAAVLVLRRWTETHPRLGLCFWLISRSIGVAMLAVSVALGSIRVAIAGRIFEGLANDNLLHYALAAIYVRTKDPDRFSRLMGSSLALYMAGTALGPTAVALLPNFSMSFIVAMALLILSLCYLGTVRVGSSSISDDSRAPSDQGSALAPISLCFKERSVILPAMAMFFYNGTQSYLFPLIMVHTALNFGFGSTENGYIVSIAALTSSVYLTFVLYVVPRLRQTRPASPPSTPGAENIETGRDNRQMPLRNWACAVLSMAIQLVVLPCFMAIRIAPMVYMMVVLVALGLAAPSFIKSYNVERSRDKGQALVCLAIMESLGGMLSPVVLGSAQSLLGSGAFAVASGLVGAATLSLIGSLFINL